MAWFETVGTATELRIRRVAEGAAAGPPLTVATVRAGRSSGFPRLARAGDAAVLVWTDPAAGPRVRTALITLVPR